METRKLTDQRGGKNWVCARWDGTRVVIHVYPSTVNVALSSQDEVRDLVGFLDAIKGKQHYDKPPPKKPPPTIQKLLRGEMRVEARRSGLSLAWQKLGTDPPDYRVYASLEELDLFLHDLMHLGWMIKTDG